MNEGGSIERPVFFIGMPRSGTTVLFEAFARHPDLGWLSNYSEMWPQWPVANMLCRFFDNRVLSLRGHKKQYGRVIIGNRYLPQPVEAYPFWDLYTQREFSLDYLLGEEASTRTTVRVRRAVGAVLKYQHKNRLATKLTGPGRIGYINSIFPDAVYIHVIRDGRSVVNSLLNVRFWKEKGGFKGPFWKNGLRPQDLRQWNDYQQEPAVLAAIQWIRVIETTREEASALGAGQYQEVKYEDFVSEPVQVLSGLFDSIGLDSANAEDYVSSIGADLRNMNKKKTGVSDARVLDQISGIMGPMLQDLGYQC